MNLQCETAANLLPDYWQNGLEHPDRAGDRVWLMQHLEGCHECAELTAFWRQMGALPAAAPDPCQRERFDQMLAAYEEGLQTAQRRQPAARTSWFSGWLLRPMPAMAAAVLIAIGVGAGLVGGWALHTGSTNSSAASANQEIADLRDQVQTTRQLVVLSLLQQQSASDRLQVVTYSARLPQADFKVSEALLRSLKYDSSPDVRLAALDALQRDAQAPALGSDIRRGLVDAFSYQTSPLVQIALVDSFVQTRDQQAKVLLEQIQKDSHYLPEVRQRAAWGLSQPTWN
ncbi:MAG: hypothetical protein ACRD2D_07070 [Terriglobales bacterium]